jgi:hypothetical protein
MINSNLIILKKYTCLRRLATKPEYLPHTDQTAYFNTLDYPAIIKTFIKADRPPWTCLRHSSYRMVAEATLRNAWPPDRWHYQLRGYSKAEDYSAVGCLSLSSQAEVAMRLEQQEGGLAEKLQALAPRSSAWCP